MKLRGFFTILILLGVGAFIVAGEKEEALQEKATLERNRIYLEVEVAINGVSYRQSDAGSFIIQGYLYPKGTLIPTLQSNGVLADGSAEFPELVIGRWLCKGWSIPLREGQPIAVNSTTTQTFEMNLDYPGLDAIHSEGFEYQELSTISPRVILGGTGVYGDIQGQQLQAVIGVNPSRGANMQVTFMRKWIVPFKSDPSRLTLEEVSAGVAPQEQ